jgi:hypothetical protein
VPEGMRWRVTKAVRRSGLPSPARLIMLTLADVAEVGTAEIPARHTPSLAVLAEETGLNESTVKRHLNDLETAGWVIRARPSPRDARLHGARTRYRLAIPPGAEEALVGAQEAQEGAESAQGEGAEEALSGRTQRPKEDLRSSSDQDQIKDTSEEPEEPRRVDVEQICRHLADRIEGNGSKRPNITKKWRTEARLLLDKDGRTVEQVVKAIDWCQDDTFWKANVLSMPKLREQYDRLRLDAQRKRAGPSDRPSTTDQRVSAALALKNEFRDEQQRSIGQ